MGALSSKRKEVSLDGEEIGFDHFQVLRAIGKGSFGKVCIVQKCDTKQMFAMKYMNKAQCEAREALSNVFREMEILASLNHPFLVNLWFSFQDSEDMFMVVDLLLGGDLRYHVQQGVQFTDQAVRLYILEVASALSYLHARHIIHRDIKPDNLLLDEEGHVHLTDFNIATVLRPGQLATSMSGTKPYMAPEVFECVADTCEGYSYQVDWWSLGVTAYEVRRGKRPFDIHSNTSLHDIRRIFQQAPTFPSSCHTGLVHVISKLLTVSVEKRIQCLDQLMQLPYAATITADDVIKKRVKPVFTPPKDHLNCDPTFELEEMIIESRPLHKKKKRLSKQKSIRETQSSISGTTEGEAVVYERMLVFNRELEEKKREREKREAEWQAELEESMKLSDPTGHGCNFSGSNTSTPVKQRSRSCKENSSRRAREDVDHGGTGGRAFSTPLAASSASSLLLTSPTEQPQLPKIAVSPSNVKARIAGSPKVKVRGTTVTIESPRSSSSLTKSSTQQLKERLRELKADQHCHGNSGSGTEYSDVTQSDDLTLTGRRSPPRSPDRPQGRSVSKSPERPQRRSTSVSPKRSPRRSTGGSSRRSPARSSRKPSGNSPKELKRSSTVPQEEGTDEVASTSSVVISSAALVAQESSSGGDAVVSRPLSLPAAVCHEFGQLSNKRISAPAKISTSSRSSSRESGVSLEAQKVLEPTDASTRTPPMSRETQSEQKSVLMNGSLSSSRTSRKSPIVQDLTLEDKVSLNKKPTLVEQRRRHSMEPRRKSVERSKRFSESHRSSSVTSKKDSDNWSNSSEFRKRSSLPCKRDPENWRSSFETQKNQAEAVRNSPEILKKAPDTAYKSSDIRKRCSLPSKRDPDTFSNSPDFRKRSSLPSKRDPDNWRKSFEIHKNTPEAFKNVSDAGVTSFIRKTSSERIRSSSVNTENSDEVRKKSRESPRKSFDESKSRSSSVSDTASTTGVDESVKTHKSSTDNRTSENLKNSLESQEPRNDANDEGIQMAC
ncbi:hypothetical protein OTU49_002284 [Cherax quadricarinatus]|uniref:Protein kinase domain-containing protein n=1 Tax=Cherax quadricarinatus TaxID=27406 RepID=A0AAW0XB65_CHEQU